jgi:transcriptional regulator with XRE-family HTH domain
MTLDHAKHAATFGDRLRRRRTLRGWTQDELAARIGIDDRSNIGNWENRRSLPQFAQLLALAEAFEINEGELMRGVP